MIFWASLEHMTVPERLIAIREAWSLLAAGSNLVVIETPNRLWPYDSHTAFLPFFNWLPDELAFDYVQNSARDGLADTYVDPERQMLEFQRLGRGVSYHEFELALGKGFVTASSMQIHRRSRNPARRLAWSVSSSGRVERHLHSFAPHIDRAWLQPFLYLAIAKP